LLTVADGRDDERRRRQLPAGGGSRRRKSQRSGGHRSQWEVLAANRVGCDVGLKKVKANERDESE
jgi:hypothetical protein